eukprot:GHRQ01024014.1.p1 GENE.GHRQ01024014.1~~GHRQ01024014.1.p1  ORF type:complete len:199 (+),score=62.12 GHRQ01024014.1:327-923(+)
MDMRSSCVLVNETKLKVDLTKYAERHQFNFDEALDEYVTNDQVYRVTVEPLVHTLFNNGKATCFAYGQTGSGKTHTMSPLPIRAADILQYLVRPELRDVSLFVSCFEIYGNKVFDLLNMRKKLNILEDGKKKVCVVGLKVSGPGWHCMLPQVSIKIREARANKADQQPLVWLGMCQLAGCACSTGANFFSSSAGTAAT